MGRKIIDLTGQKFGKLTVIERKYLSNKWGRIIWLCKCDCGKEKIIYGYNLVREHTKSCGCLQKERTIENRRFSLGFASMRQTIKAYKRSAKIRGYSFELTEEQFTKITQKDCHYCGAKPNNKTEQKGYFGNYIYNGIDRVDNNRGYTLENSVPCCKRCNTAKNNSTIQEYQDWIKKSYNKLFV
jgi:hypothetical protein